LALGSESVPAPLSHCSRVALALRTHPLLTLCSHAHGRAFGFGAPSPSAHPLHGRRVPSGRNAAAHLHLLGEANLAPAGAGGDVAPAVERSAASEGADGEDSESGGGSGSGNGWAVASGQGGGGGGDGSLTALNLSRNAIDGASAATRHSLS
jgi:hypothetical protein